MKKITLLTLFLSFILTSLNKLYAQPGSLDVLSFGNGIGYTTTNVADSGNIARAIAIQPDGKIVLAGYGKKGITGIENFAVKRYTTSGNSDNSFGNITTAITTATNRGYACAIQNDGKIIVAGIAYTTNGEFALIRYNANGTIDAGFGNGGKVISTLGSGDDGIYAIALQSDGKIVVAGYTTKLGVTNIAVARYNTNGTLDNSFNTIGYTYTPVGANSSAAFTMALQTDGKIVVAGFCKNTLNRDVALLRYNTDGSLDNTFNTNGIVITAIGNSDEQAQAVKIQNDGKIVIAGRSNNGSNDDFTLIRYNADGSIDNSFNNNGIVLTSIGSGNDWANALEIQADGKIVVAGYSNNGSNNDLALASYTTSGQLDHTFGNGGKAITPIGTDDDAIHSMAIQTDGKIVVAGYSRIGGTLQFMVARYTTNLSSTSSNFIKNSTIAIYPNPNNGQFTITSDNIEENASAIIYNAIGAEVYQQRITRSTETLNTELSNGIYLLKVITDKGISMQKIIVTR